MRKSFPIISISTISRKERGFTLIETIVAAAILSLTAAAFLNLFTFGARQSARAEQLLQAVNLAQARLEELKNVPAAAVTGRPRTSCPENPAYTYSVETVGSSLGYGLKTVTVIIYYQEAGEEKRISLTMEKGDWETCL